MATKINESEFFAVKSCHGLSVYRRRIPVIRTLRAAAVGCNVVCCIGEERGDDGCSGTMSWWPDDQCWISVLATRAGILSYVSRVRYCTYTVSYCTGSWRKLSVGSGPWWTMIRSDRTRSHVRMMSMMCIVRLLSPECLVSTIQEVPHLSINLHFIIVTKL